MCCFGDMNFFKNWKLLYMYVHQFVKCTLNIYIFSYRPYSIGLFYRFVTKAFVCLYFATPFSVACQCLEKQAN